MTAFFAIVSLTCRSALRSNIFRTLLFFLLLSVVLVPNTIRGDGTAQGYIQVILEYSLAFVTFLLSVSTIWLANAEMCNDVESGQLHMIVVKPISRVTVWLGKFTGVLFIHTVLLVISATAIFGFVFYQYKQQKFSDVERERLQNEVFAGRRVFMPEQPDVDQLVIEEEARRVEAAKVRGERLTTLSGEDRATLRQQLKKEVLSNLGEVKIGTQRFWTYKGLPKAEKGTPLFIRYKAFGDTPTSTNKQTLAYGAWLMRGMQPIREQGGGDETKIIGYEPFYVTKMPEDILCGSPVEFPADAEFAIHNDGTASFGFVNLSKDGKSIHFQTADGPKLLLKITGFTENYCRAVLVMFLGLVALTGVACSFGAAFALPTAIFMTISYLVIGMASSYLAGTLITNLPPGVSRPLMEAIGEYASRLMLMVLIPLQDFSVSEKLPSGELVEYSQMGRLILMNLVLRGLPLFLLGAWIYRKRELGIAMKR